MDDVIEEILSFLEFHDISNFQKAKIFVGYKFWGKIALKHIEKDYPALWSILITDKQYHKINCWDLLCEMKDYYVTKKIHYEYNRYTHEDVYRTIDNKYDDGGFNELYKTCDLSILFNNIQLTKLFLMNPIKDKISKDELHNLTEINNTNSDYVKELSQILLIDKKCETMKLAIFRRMIRRGCFDELIAYFKSNNLDFAITVLQSSTGTQRSPNNYICYEAYTSLIDHRHSDDESSYPKIRTKKFIEYLITDDRIKAYVDRMGFKNYMKLIDPNLSIETFKEILSDHNTFFRYKTNDLFYDLIMRYAHNKQLMKLLFTHPQFKGCPKYFRSHESLTYDRKLYQTIVDMVKYI